MKSPFTSSASLLPNESHSSSMPSLTPAYPGLLLSLTLPREILPSPSSSPSIKALLLSESLQPTSYSHWSLSRSARPSLLPSLLPAPPSLSFWWIGGSTELWSHSLTTNLVPYSVPSSPSWLNYRRLTTQNWWRLRWVVQKELDWLKRKVNEEGFPYHSLD